MTAEEKREQTILDIADLLRSTTFTFEFKVVKRPEGIRIISEVTQEQMDEITQQVEAKTEVKTTPTSTPSSEPTKHR